MASGGLNKAISYRGWTSVLVAFIFLFFVFGAPVSTMPLVYAHVIKEFHWTHSQSTLAFTYKNWVGAVASTFLLGPAIEKLGLRVVMLAAAVMTGAGMLSFLFISNLWTYYAAFIPIGLGQAMVMIGVKILVSRWYTRNQGLAIGIALAGTSLGGIVFPLVWSVLISHFGWRMAMAAIGLTLMLVAIPVYLFLARENPTEEEIVPEAMKTAPNPQMAQRMRQADIGLSFTDVLKTPMFWLAALGILLIQAVDAGMFQHTALYLQNEKGLPANIAAAGISFTFALGIFSKIFAGWFFDRFSIKGIQMWWVFIGLVILLAFPVQGFVTMMIFSLSRGLAHGGLVSESPIIAKHCFGPRLMNQVYPVLAGALALGSGLGPWIVSAMYDHFGHYREAFAVLIGMAFIAALLMFLVRPLYRDRLLAAAVPETGDGDLVANGGPGLPAGAAATPA
jgi:OFA family oxalate/formate antiporter-like MFS transporter